VGLAWVHQEDSQDPDERYGVSTTANEGNSAMTKKKHPNRGSTLDSFLEAEGLREEIEARAIKEVIAWQLTRAMAKKRMTKSRMASLMGTSRAQLDRLLDPKRDVTLSTLTRAAGMVGRRLRVELA
jgi:antitoxin HicB